MEEESQKIRVFPIEDPQVWYQNRDAIKKTILAAINPELPGFLNVKYTFSIDQVSGWIRYNLESDLWLKSPKRSLPRTREDATNSAKKFIANLQELLTHRNYLKLEIPPIIPYGNIVKIEHLETSPVLHLDEPWVDHWLCRFEIRIKPFKHSNTLELVYGSSIDIRIGQNGKVVSFISQWRPVWIEKVLMGDFILFHNEKNSLDDGPEEKAHKNSHNSSHEAEETHEHKFIYELDGENCPQTFLSPYFFTLDGHHGEIKPASNYSIVPGMLFVEKETGGTTVFATASGGSGEFTVSWAYWQPDTIFDDGLTYLGEATKIELPPGVFNLLMYIKDNKLNVIRVLEKMVFVKAIQSVESEINPLP